MKQYKVFLSPTEYEYVTAETAEYYTIKENPGVTLLVFTIDKKIIASFNIANILGATIVREINIKEIVNKGV